MKNTGGGVIFVESVAHYAQTGWIQVRAILRIPAVGVL